MTMNGLSKMIATTFLLVLAIVPAAFAETHTVGGTSRWAQNVDYTEWVKGKSFKVGDILEFKYGPSHSVAVVNKAGYDGCDSSSATDRHSDGDTDIELKTVGPMYFICPTGGHCESGQKLVVTVEAASTGTPNTPSPPSSTPGTPSTPNSPPAAGTPAATTSPPPPPKGSASKGVMSYVLVGVSMVLSYGLLMF